MHITAIALLLSILGLMLSFFFVGIIPSIPLLILNIAVFMKKKSINNVRMLSISVVGVLLPIIMYLNCYGFSLPYEKEEKLPIISQILYDNYTGLGLDLSFMVQGGGLNKEELVLGKDVNGEVIYFVSDGVDVSEEGVKPAEVINGEGSDEAYENGQKEYTGLDAAYTGIKQELDENSIFESIDSNRDASKSDKELAKKAASDDDMPSYGGLPIGTLILGQYFREDDHNCNPVLVLKNSTGKTCRFECVFTARDEEGNELATSNKTVEAVKDGMLFVFEGRFDKGELGGKMPSMYEFLISKRDPYEKDMYDDVAVFGEIVGNSAFVTAQNTSDKRVKVDAYVLFFDGSELVDCIWMIPRNTGEVCIDPGSSAAIKGDAYYKFDRIETYYTAYEAVGE